MTKTIFQKIIDREIPAKIIYETDDVLAFHDITPQAPTHILVIPKKTHARLADVPAEEERLLGKLLLAAVHAAKLCGLEQSGFRLVINNGPNAGESVPHLHVHVLGGRQMQWPPG
ncbi:MAG: histidine triad nucleotide-binding protein [bacterium]